MAVHAVLNARYHTLKLVPQLLPLTVHFIVNDPAAKESVQHAGGAVVAALVDSTVTKAAVFAVMIELLILNVSRFAALSPDPYTILPTGAAGECVIVNVPPEVEALEAVSIAYVPNDGRLLPIIFTAPPVVESVMSPVAVVVNVEVLSVILLALVRPSVLLALNDMVAVETVMEVPAVIVYVDPQLKLVEPL
jgi:hypothetical protein